jgi:hypothetical protein
MHRYLTTIIPFLFTFIVGEFRSEALQVPHGCRFGHVDDRQMCEDYAHWESQAHGQCDKKVRLSFDESILFCSLSIKNK